MNLSDPLEVGSCFAALRTDLTFVFIDSPHPDVWYVLATHASGNWEMRCYTEGRAAHFLNQSESRWRRIA